jgi:Uma2 family endonuclease
MMAMMVLDRDIAARLKAEREQSGLDRYDEVWEGTYVMSPIANIEHQDIQLALGAAIRAALGPDSDASVNGGANVSDREDDWLNNYRIPDVVVVFPGGRARHCDTHWCGGPDFTAEITSPGETGTAKLSFYESIGVREFLVIDRHPWRLELFQLTDAKLRSVGQSDLGTPIALTSRVLPVSFRLIPGPRRPRIEVSHHDGVQRWTV